MNLNPVHIATRIHQAITNVMDILSRGLKGLKNWIVGIVPALVLFVEKIRDKIFEWVAKYYDACYDGFMSLVNSISPLDDPTSVLGPMVHWTANFIPWGTIFGQLMLLGSMLCIAWIYRLIKSFIPTLS